MFPLHNTNRFGRHLSDTLFEQVLWLSRYIVGVAKKKGKVALVRTKTGTTSNDEPWVYFTTVNDNWGYRGTGPFFLTVLVDLSFTGKINLAKHDKRAAGLEVGRSGDSSSTQSKVEIVLVAVVVIVDDDKDALCS